MYAACGEMQLLNDPWREDSIILSSSVTLLGINGKHMVFFVRKGQYMKNIISTMTYDVDSMIQCNQEEELISLSSCHWLCRPLARLRQNLRHGDT